jgi:dolichol-phosphate mannosyltransferase
MKEKLVSLVIPIFCEEKNIVNVYDEIIYEWKKSCLQYDREIIFVDDGSSDASAKIIQDIMQKDQNVHFIQFSRNFGKEMALTAGLHKCKGDACIMMDADLQHPVSLLPKFIQRWDSGSDVVIGVRNISKSDHWIKRIGGNIFYKIMQKISDVPIIPHATDYRLLDRVVIDVFNKLPERNRMTRGLIDWLGFSRSTILFDAIERANGESRYSIIQLCRLALTSFISFSMLPLRITGYLGIFIVVSSLIFGVVILLDRYIFEWGFHFSGTAMLIDVILFLIGIVLIALGLLAFYIADIYHEAQGRPMYIIKKQD